MSDVRLSAPTLRVLKMMLDDPRKGLSGADLSLGAKVGSGTLYPLLRRLEAAGWLRAEWEDMEPIEAGRPKRRYYWLTAAGQNSARDAFQDFQVPQGVPSWGI